MELLQERHHGVVAQDHVAALRRVTGDVAQRPDRLPPTTFIRSHITQVSGRSGHRSKGGPIGGCRNLRLRFPAPLTCSLTSSLGEMRSWTKMGTAPSAITTLVWSEVPDAMLVSAQAASNCSGGLSWRCHHKSRGRAGGCVSLRRVLKVMKSCEREEHGCPYLEELHEARHHAGVDDVLDGRVLLDREQLPELGGCLELVCRVVRADPSHHLRQVLETLGHGVVRDQATGLAWHGHTTRTVAESRRVICTERVRGRQ